MMEEIKKHVVAVVRHIHKGEPNEGEKRDRWLERYAGQIGKLFTGATKRMLRETCSALKACDEAKIDTKVSFQGWLEDRADEIIGCFPEQKQEEETVATEDGNDGVEEGGSNTEENVVEGSQPS